MYTYGFTKSDVATKANPSERMILLNTEVTLRSGQINTEEAWPL